MPRILSQPRLPPFRRHGRRPPDALISLADDPMPLPTHEQIADVLAWFTSAASQLEADLWRQLADVPMVRV